MSDWAATADPPRATPPGAPPPPEPMSSADAAWWRMDERHNQMVITAVLTFAQGIAWERLEHVVETRLLAYDRFRQRVIGHGLALPTWEFDPEFDLSRHLVRVSLPPPAGRRELEALVGDEMTAALDHARPLWRFVYVDNYAGGAALVARIHHCVADGIALIRLLLSLDDTPGNENDVDGMRREPWRPPCAARVEASRTALGRAAAGLGVGAAVGVELLRLATLRSDPRTPLRGPLAVAKRAAWADPIPLAEVKAVGGRMGATVNDVLMSAVAGGLRSYLEGRGAPVPRRALHAVVPVNLRPASLSGGLGNRFGLLFMALPVPARGAAERLRTAKRTMDRLKRSPQALVVYGLLRVFGRTGRLAVKAAVHFLGRGASLVMTDVPGPREPVWFCGRELRELIAWVPQSGNLALGVGVLGYAGRVQVAVAADAARVPDPERLVEAIHRAFAELAEGAAARER